MKRRFIILALVLVVGGVFLSSCQKEEPLSSKKEVLSFIFEASKNAELDHNILGVISGTSITATVPFGTDVSILIPSIEVSPKAQLTPASAGAIDFSSPVSFTVTAEDGSTKEFTAAVPVEPAPYIGSWTSSTIDFGQGLMHVVVTMDAEGHFEMKLQELVTGELDAQSVKGYFNPLAEPKTETELVQTHRWVDEKWTEMSEMRTIMYHFDAKPKMRFYYCYCYPKNSWAFEVDLTKE